MTSRLDELPGRRCSIAGALDVVGDRWALLVIREVSLGAHRFSEIRRGTGAPREQLTARLGALVEAGGAIVTNAMLMGVLYGTRRIRGRKIIDVLVCRIRQKLGAGAQVVDAVWGRGYRFLAEAPVPVAVSA